MRALEGAAMDDEQFYRELSALDKGVADRWKRVTGKLRATISDDAIVTIFGPITASHKITAKQAQAMQTFWMYTYAKMTDRAKELFTEVTALAYDFDWFFAGSAKPLVTDDDLREFHAALNMNLVGRINFVSPRTGLSYFPGLYTAVNLLVAKGLVKVYSVDAAALLSRGGLYRSDINRLVIYEGLDPVLKLPTIVHEATHAIQDWRDLVSVHQFAEADAFVAQAVAAISTGKKYFLEYLAQEDAGRLVLAGKGAAGNAEFEAAYLAIVKAIEGDRQYINVKDVPWKPAAKEKGTDEAKILAQLLKDIKQAEDFAEWGKNALDETFVKPAREGIKLLSDEVKALGRPRPRP
jgi:hypothetical protein